MPQKSSDSTSPPPTHTPPPPHPAAAQPEAAPLPPWRRQRRDARVGRRGPVAAQARARGAPQAAGAGLRAPRAAGAGVHAVTGRGAVESGPGRGEPRTSGDPGARRVRVRRRQDLRHGDRIDSIDAFSPRRARNTRNRNTASLLLSHTSCPASPLSSARNRARGLAHRKST